MKSIRTFLSVLILMIAILFMHSACKKEANADNITINYERVEETVKDKQGNIIAEMYFNKPVFGGSSPLIKKLNSYFENEVQGFFNGYEKSLHFKKSQRDHFFESVTEMRTLYEDDILAKSPLYYKVEIELQCDNNILSFKETEDWMAGGIRNTYYYGITVNKETGDILSLENIADEDIKNFNDKVILALNNELNENSREYDLEPLFSEIENYNFSDYEFYCDENNIYIIFNYEIFSTGGFILKLSKD